MPRPFLPMYYEDEVASFHPVFEYAANKMLRESGLNSDFQISHHRPIGGGIEVDFAFERISNGKIVLLCELKRTISDVRSLRTRVQAQGYFTEAGMQVESNYYLISNLEIVDLFKFSPERRRIAQQQVTPSPLLVGRLGITDEDQFYDGLERCLRQIFATVIEDRGIFIEGLTGLQSVLGDVQDNPTRWHQVIMPASYEYLRGAANNFSRLQQKVNGARWLIAENYRGQPSSLIAAGRRIDFDALFSEPSPIVNDEDAFNSRLLNDAFNSGKRTADGSELTAIIEEILAPSKPGLVQTDSELANLLAMLLKDALGRNLQDGELVCDPMAGCGNLLIAAGAAFSNLLPNQVLAIDNEPRFMEILSVRLGLLFAEVLNRSMHPNITCDDLLNLPSDYFSNIKVIIMNPPFLSGISSVQERAEASRRIMALRGSPSLLNQGQVGLEAVLLEAVWELVPDGTVIGTVFPLRYKGGLSQEVVNVRKFFCNEFGLTHLALYPRKGLFQDVVKHTLLAVGIKGTRADHVKWLNIQVPLENIDLAELRDSLGGDGRMPVRGTNLKHVPIGDLLQTCVQGWNRFTDYVDETSNWFSLLAQDMVPLSELAAAVVRGSSGNQGCSTLCMFDAIGLGDNGLAHLVPEDWLVPAIKLSKKLPFLLTSENAPNFALILPQNVWIEGTPENLILESLVVEYEMIESEIPRSGTQPRAQLNALKIKSALSCNSLSPVGSVLIPRDIRRVARIGILGVEAVISTNFFIAKMFNMDDSTVLASWLSSVFSQIDMELKNLDQEGTRKLEGKQIKSLSCPKLDRIPVNIKAEMREAFFGDKPLDFTALTPRRTDLLWANFFMPDRPDEFLEEAFDFLTSLCQRRSLNT